MGLLIRQENIADYKQTERLVECAFQSAKQSDGNEHRLVEKLRHSDAFIPSLSLVAVDEESGQLVGHVLLTKMEIQADKDVTTSLALAPVSVLPNYQRQGIGKQLIKEGLTQAMLLEYRSVIVLGDPVYYERFGFKPASRWGIAAPFPVPDEVFMALELAKGGLEGVSGTVQYDASFME